MSPFQTKPTPSFPKFVREPMPDVTLNSLKASLNTLSLDYEGRFSEDSKAFFQKGDTPNADEEENTIERQAHSSASQKNPQNHLQTSTVDQQIQRGTPADESWKGFVERKELIVEDVVEEQAKENFTTANTNDSSFLFNTNEQNLFTENNREQDTENLQFYTRDFSNPEGHNVFSEGPFTECQHDNCY